MEEKIRELLENIRNFIGLDGIVYEQYSEYRDQLCREIAEVLDGKEHKDTMTFGGRNESDG